MDKKISIEKTPFDKLYIINEDIHSDMRGSFSKIFSFDMYQEILYQEQIKQINYSRNTTKGTFRGFHFQYPPFNETKVVKCIKGKVLDMVIDIRKNSKTFLKLFSIELSQNDHKMLLIPNGFAHGFLTLEDNSELLYLHTQEYVPNSEGGINLLDPKLKVELPIEIRVISDKDKNYDFIKQDFLGI